MKLSDFPYKDIFIGMDVISYRGTPGKIVQKLELPDTDWGVEALKIQWSNGASSVGYWRDYSSITLPEPY